MPRVVTVLMLCLLAVPTVRAEENKPATTAPPPIVRNAYVPPLLTGKASADFAARERLLHGNGTPDLPLNAQQLEQIEQMVTNAEANAQPSQPSRPSIGYTPADTDDSVTLGVLMAMGIAVAVFGAWWGLGALLAERRNRPVDDTDLPDAPSDPSNGEPASDRRPEVPLTGFARFRVVAGAVLGIAAFYTVASVLVFVLLIVLLVGIALAILLARFGLWRMARPLIDPHLRLLVLLAKSAWTRDRPELFVALKPGDAPRLSAIVARLAASFAVPVPKTIVVEMTAGAWIELGGWRARSKSTKLGLGYDLIAGLSEAELEAVIAHEMAHAKFVQRGLKRALNKGVHRAARATNGVAELVYAHRAAKVNFDSGETVLTLLRWCTRFSAKRVAAYSRQDEFEADLGAARVCGGAPLRSALERVQSIQEATARIGWTERLARMQMPGGLGRWLAETVQGHVASAAEPSHAFDEYATHPSEEDRFRALPDTPATNPNDGPAVNLLEDAGALARRLIEEIQAKVLESERRDTKARARWLRRLRRKAKIRPQQYPAVFFVVVGLIVAALTIDAQSAWPAVAGLAIISGAVYWYRRERFRDRVPLPVPTLEEIKIAFEAEDDPATREARRKEIEAAIEPLSAGVTPDAAFVRVRDEAHAALRRAEPLRAFVCFRRMQALRSTGPETEMIGAVALAMLKADAAPLLNSIVRNTGLHSTGSLWATAWALYLLHQPQNAEPLLEELTRRDPTEVTYAGVLALCQARRGKIQTAVENARRAFEDLPTSTARRELLVDLLVSTGRLDEAEQLLNAIPIGEHPGLVLSMVRLKLMRGDRAEADQWVAKLKQAPETGHYLVSAATCYEQARCDDAARECYHAALGIGFHPAAELGLARLALHTRDHAEVERHALAAINTSRPLAPKAVGPLPLFLSAIGIVNATRPRLLGLRAWLVTAPPEKALGALQRNTFLVYAHKKTQAAETVMRVLAAALPDQPPLPVERLSVSFAQSDRQPIRAVPPGIQAVWVQR